MGKNLEKSLKSKYLTRTYYYKQCLNETLRIVFFVCWAIYGTVPTLHWVILRSVIQGYLAKQLSLIPGEKYEKYGSGFKNTALHGKIVAFLHICKQIPQVFYTTTICHIMCTIHYTHVVLFFSGGFGDVIIRTFLPRVGKQSEIYEKYDQRFVCSIHFKNIFDNLLFSRIK